MPESVVHFQIRMPPQQHERLATWAKEDKVSLNLLVVGILEKAMEATRQSRGRRRAVLPILTSDLPLATGLPAISTLPRRGRSRSGRLINDMYSIASRPGGLCR